MIIVVKDLFVDLCILNFFLLMWGYVFRDDKSDGAITRLIIKIKIGLAMGILGVLFMIYNIQITEGAPFIDLRIIALILSYYLGGTMAAIVSGTMISIVRVTFFELNVTSILAIVVIVLCIVSFKIIYMLFKTQKVRWVIMQVWALTMHVPTLYYSLRGLPIAINIIVIYIVLSLISSMIVYKMVEYVKSMNLVYKHFKIDATTDFLTGLDNLRCFNEKLIEIKKELPMSQNYLVYMMLDIDYFKRINDTYGHPSGDLVLQQFAQILNQYKGQTGSIARVGGEEFVVLKPCQYSDILAVLDIAEKIRKNTNSKEFFIEDGRKIKVTVSIGVTIIDYNCDNIQQLITLADEALYNAKNSGRNRVVMKTNSPLPFSMEQYSELKEVNFGEFDKGYLWS